MKEFTPDQVSVEKSVLEIVQKRAFDDIVLDSAAIHPVENEIRLLKNVADHVISNDGTIENLYEQFDEYKKS